MIDRCDHTRLQSPPNALVVDLSPRGADAQSAVPTRIRCERRLCADCGNSCQAHGPDRFD
jgi:hypothetical protein